MSGPTEKVRRGDIRPEPRAQPQAIPLPSWLALPKHGVRRKDAFDSGPASRAASVNASSGAPASRDPHHWWAGRPLSEAKNAHRTNTKGDFEMAMDSDANFFECDVRKEINSDRLECRHDVGQEDGDNLTLAEWLKKGKASGRGLKVELKEPELAPQLIAELKKSGVPQDRLMINLSAGAMAQWGPKLRQEFPNATLAISGGTSPAEVDQMLATAKKVGGPVTFVLDYDKLNAPAISRLQKVAPVSVWNSPSSGTVKDADEAAEALRSRGVQGMIDLREPESTVEKVEHAVERKGRETWDRFKSGVSSVLDSIGL